MLRLHAFQCHNVTYFLSTLRRGMLFVETWPLILAKCTFWDQFDYLQTIPSAIIQSFTNIKLFHHAKLTQVKHELNSPNHLLPYNSTIHHLKLFNPYIHLTMATMLNQTQHLNSYTFPLSKNLHDIEINQNNHTPNAYLKHDHQTCHFQLCTNLAFFLTSFYHL